jgi:hypothetical protein
MRIACTKSVRKRGGLTVGGLFSSDQRDQVPSLRRVEAQSVQAIYLYKINKNNLYNYFKI